MKWPGNKVLMIAPSSFRSNEETKASNSFQRETTFDINLLGKARFEHQSVQNLLTSHGLEVLCYEEEKGADTPDALFPNNWFCTFPNGKLILFPMLAPNRRREYRTDIIQRLSENVTDLRYLENHSHFLEGTGSLVLDHLHRIAYACLSPRTHLEALKIFENASGYKVISFSAVDPQDHVIYHTNVMMALGEKTAVVYTNGIKNSDQRKKVVDSLNRELITINDDQLMALAGNILLLQNKNKQRFWIMSTKSFEALDQHQKQKLETDGKILHTDISTIEKYGGGGIRCLIAEIL